MFMLISFVIALVSAIVIYYFQKNNKGQNDNIPSVSGLPLALGLLQQKPHDEIEDIIHKSSKGHDMYYYRMGPFKFINIVNPDYVKTFLMESADVFPKFKYPSGNILNQLFGDGVPFSNGHKWQTYRKVANTAFNKEMSPEVVGETVMDLFAFMQQNANQPIDVFEVMQRTTIELLGKLAFGHQFGCFKTTEKPYIMRLYGHILSCLGSPFRFIFPWINNLPTESNRKFFGAMQEFNDYFLDILETKRKEFKNKKNSHCEHADVLSSMLEIGEQEGIKTDTEQLRDEIVDLFVAGHNTTSMAISCSLYYLAKYPEMQERARVEVISIFGNELVIPTSDQLKELRYLNAIIKESLRIFPPSALLMFREAPKPVKIGPYELSTNDLYLVNIWQIHHDPKHWENPKQYDPERFLRGEKRHPFSWIPFSAGPRNCLGQNLTLLEQRVILSMILLKYTWTLPENNINKDKLMLETHFFLKPMDLKLIFTERNLFTGIEDYDA